jgi:hypothetical protein
MQGDAALKIQGGAALKIQGGASLKIQGVASLKIQGWAGWASYLAWKKGRVGWWISSVGLFT